MILSPANQPCIFQISKRDQIHQVVWHIYVIWEAAQCVKITMTETATLSFNSSEDPTRESFLSETNFLVSKLRRNTSLPCLSYYPNPSVIPSITQLKTWRLEPSRWQVHKCLFQNKATLTYGGREGSLLAASSTIPGRGSTIHVTIAKSLGGSKTKNR